MQDEEPVVYPLIPSYTIWLEQIKERWRSGLDWIRIRQGVLGTGPETQHSAGYTAGHTVYK
jgi:hypothetical protein